MIDLGTIPDNPLLLFSAWFDEAIQSGVSEPAVMTLSTATKSGMPSSRIVLLKSFNQEGFTFFTNFLSRKGREIEENPFVALLFFWNGLKKQVRVEGRAHKIPGRESDIYFKIRPRGSQIGAWASPQSQTIKDRQYLEKKAEEYSNKFSPTAIPRPPHWGGYIVKPQQIEFWAEKPDRLHDRILYRRIDENWVLSRLAP